MSQLFNILNLIALIFTTGCLYLVFKIKRATRNGPVNYLVLAFGYSTLLRVIIVVCDIIDYPINLMPAYSLFHVVSLIGFYTLYRQIKLITEDL